MKMGGYFSCLSGGIYCGEPWWGRLFGSIVFFSLRGWDYLTFSCLNSSNLPENLPVININYSLVTCHFKDKLNLLPKICRISYNVSYSLPKEGPKNI